MKHIFGEEHHAHLKKRAILELFGLITLVFFSITQWEIIDEALFAISKSNVYYLLAAITLYWIFLPLTAVSYLLLSEKKISLRTTTLAQLAGSGPGRIIPGGLGHIGVSVMHLRKIGLTTQKAIIISVANNVIGLGVNVGLLIALFATQPRINSIFREKLTTSSVIFVVLMVIGIITLTQWLLHARQTRSSILKVNKQWKTLFKYLSRNPHNLFGLYGIALLILIGNVSILILSARALGLHLSFIDSLVALSAGVFVGGILPTPGGLGGVEAGTASMLLLLGFGATESTSIALLFRTITYWQPLIPGTLAYFYLRERKLL